MGKINLFGSSWGESSLSSPFMATRLDNLLFYVSTTPWLRLQQEAEWVNMNFERKDQNSPQKITPLPMILEKFAFSFAFNLWKQNVSDFYFISLTEKKALCCAFKLLLPGTVSFSTSFK